MHQLKPPLPTIYNSPPIVKSGGKTKPYEDINKNKVKAKMLYFSGTYIDERDAPIPGVPCLTGLLVIANSPR